MVDCKMREREEEIDQQGMNESTIFQPFCQIRV